MTVAHPIAHAWLSTGGTGAQNYDEFADEAEITRIIAENPYSALAVEMPHRAPDSAGRPFTDCLTDAVRRLRTAKDAGRYQPYRDVALLYRITEPDAAPGYGLWCMVDTDEISTSADEPGVVIRNEDVFAEKVRERVALAHATGHLLSPVLLLRTGHGDELHDALDDAVRAAGPAAVADVDAAGRRHEVWPLAAGPTRDRLLALAGSGGLVVADGNHRSLAAQQAGLPRFLAVVTTPGSVAIRPYHRLVDQLTVSPAELVARLAEHGSTVVPIGDRPPPAPAGTVGVGVPPDGGTVHLYSREGAWAVTLPTEPGAGAVDRIDHARVERYLFGDLLGLDPGDKRVTYVGGDYPASWLRTEVDQGRADLAILIAPVTVAEFVAVNLDRLKMPRKSTWFTPKARAGLVLAELAEPG